MNKLCVVGFFICISIQSLFAASIDRVYEQSGIQGGVVVHLSCESAEATTKLYINESYLVQGLDTDRSLVAKARNYVKSKGLYGNVTINHFNGQRLPYTSNFVNLLIMSQAQPKLPHTELFRALRPFGVLIVMPEAQTPGLSEKLVAAGFSLKRTENRLICTKPWPDEIDDWTHWLHGPDNNAVARGNEPNTPPRNMQWIQEPRWTRHHNLNPGLSALVSAKGRVFYIVDEGGVAVGGPDRWRLVARDAFNGQLLWKHDIEEWGWKYWLDKQYGAARARFTNPHQLMRRVVAIGDRVFVTPGIYAPLVAFDAATGKEIITYKGTEKTFEIAFHNKTLFLAVNKTLDEPNAEPAVSIMAVNPVSGKILWEKSGHKGVAPKVDSVARYVDAYLTLGKDRVYFLDQEFVVCLDQTTGKEKWRQTRPFSPNSKGRKYAFDYNYGNLCTLLYHDGVLYLSQIKDKEKMPRSKKNALLYAIDVVTGKTLWEFDCLTFAHQTPPDVFVVNNVIWTLDDAVRSLVGLDLKTGKTKKTIRMDTMVDWDGGHHNCYRNKATDKNLIMGKKKGTDFFDFETGMRVKLDWVKGACRYGLLPANGMLYYPSHACACWMTVKLNGFVALADEPAIKPTLSNETAIEKGPAYGQSISSPSKAIGTSWPTFRGDTLRSGFIKDTLPSNPKLKWQTQLNGKLTQAVIAESKVCLASVDRHEVYCLDEATGKVQWTYHAQGRVDSAPTIYKGRVIFGSRDGYIYCLTANSGKLIWRFRGAPHELLINSYGQIESAWPAFGSLLVMNDKIYCTAGRSGNLNTGMYLYALDLNTGKPLQSKLIRPDKDTDPLTPSGEVNGSVLADILVGDPNAIHIRGLLFQTDNFDEVTGGVKFDKGGDTLAQFPYLKAYSGFLDGTWFNSSYWIYKDRPNVGHKLVMDLENKMIYGVQSFDKTTYVRAGGSYSKNIFKVAKDQYTLFGNAITDKPLGKAKKKTKKKKKGSSPFTWDATIPVRAIGMVVGDQHIYIAGVENKTDKDDYLAYLEGRMGGLLVVHAKADGKQLAQIPLTSPPVHCGLSAAKGKLYISTVDGSLTCWE